MVTSVPANSASVLNPVVMTPASPTNGCSNVPLLPATPHKRYEAESAASGSGVINLRSKASGRSTVRLIGGKSINFPVKIPQSGVYQVVVQFSKHTVDGPPDGISLLVDGTNRVPFQAKATGAFTEGWNTFAVVTNAIGLLSAGDHAVSMEVAPSIRRVWKLTSFSCRSRGASTER